jgi:hypothetical protein
MGSVGHETEYELRRQRDDAVAEVEKLSTQLAGATAAGDLRRDSQWAAVTVEGQLSRRWDRTGENRG